MRARLQSLVKPNFEGFGLPFIALAWVSFFWGTTWIATKAGVKHMPALQMAAIRQFIAGMLFVIYFVSKRAVWPKGKQWIPVLVMGVLNFAFSNGFSTWGMQYLNSGLGAIISTVFPIWIVLISMIRGEKVSRLTITGFVICFSGICIIFMDYLSDFFKPDFQFGIIISVIATMTWASGMIYTKEKASNFNPYFSLGLQMIFSSMILMTAAELSGMTIPIREIPLEAWSAIVYLIVFGSVLTFIAFTYALQHLPKEINSLYAYINPIVAIIMGYFIYSEPISQAILLGAVVTLTGLYLVNKSLRNSKK